MLHQVVSFLFSMLTNSPVKLDLLIRSKEAWSLICFHKIIQIHLLLNIFHSHLKNLIICFTLEGGACNKLIAACMPTWLSVNIVTEVAYNWLYLHRTFFSSTDAHVRYEQSKTSTYKT